MGHTTERIGVAGKALSRPDAGGLQSERQEVLVGMVSKRGQEESTQKKYQENVFEEFLELEEQRAKESLELVQQKHMLTKVGRRKGKNENVFRDWEDRGQ